jgi:hypothetical protein
MPQYHLYCVDENERIQSRYSFDALSDRAALEKARSLCGKYAVEAWQGHRLVARLARDDARPPQV